MGTEEGQGSRRPLSELTIPLMTTMGDLRQRSADYRSDNCLSHIHDNQSSKYPRANAVLISRVYL
ncbi:hypothetical protein J6590_064476 [Homalodisca vitripennis]|nr:hypothetical protein J6590_064476 [Homalodisca vitripennis]